MSNSHSPQRQSYGGNNAMSKNNTGNGSYINAPYNFVPLADKVVTPDWADQVSHDLPFQDGLSGTIAFTLTAESPLLVGGMQQKATEREAGKVEPFKTPDGRYAIPGSSLKGMVRSVLEIATFSKMELVDDKSYGLRDISGPHVKEAYADRVRNRVKTGFLRLSSRGEPEIVPCSMARLDHRDLETWLNEPMPIFPARKSEKAVKNKYEIWKRICRKHKLSDTYIKFACGPVIKPYGNYNLVTKIGSGDLEGFLVLTGQISAENPDHPDSGKERQGRPKHLDFMFYSQKENEAFAIREVDPAAWRNFLFIHGDEDGKDEMSWPGYWKEQFWQKKDVPVFYIRSDNRLQIGLAYMPKLAGDFSIHDMIGHTSKEHTNPEQVDLATLIFGKIDDQPNASLKSRVWFELAPANGDPKPEKHPTTILGSPNPTYFPNYIKQSASEKSSWRLSKTSSQYATYLHTTHNPRPELRGRKRYPARPGDEVKAQQLNGEDQMRNSKIQICLRTLPTRTSFSGRVQFHNLKPAELGALLWSLNFGGSADCRHSLGLGKAFGFGQITLKIDAGQSIIIPNDTASTLLKIEEYQQIFRDFMKEKISKELEQTPEIRALLNMADPNKRNSFPGQLKHMIMALNPQPNEFQDAKKHGLVLASYLSELPKTDRIAPTVPERKPSAAPVTVPTAASEEIEVWEGKLLKYAPNNGVISVDNGTQRADNSSTDKKKMLDDLNLSNAAQKRLKDGKLKANVTVKHRGGNIWNIINIEVIYL